MSSSRPNDHSFVVKIWLEETLEESGRAVWRGHITHVMSSQRAHFQGFDEMVLFVLPYMDEMGIRLGAGWRLWRFLRKLSGRRRGAGKPIDLRPPRLDVGE
jgi:hypothetical protein